MKPKVAHIINATSDGLTPAILFALMRKIRTRNEHFCAGGSALIFALVVQELYGGTKVALRNDPLAGPGVKGPRIAIANYKT